MINNAWKSQKGLSLVELMVAIALGLFIIAAMIVLFVNSKESYLLNENMARLQENARFAVSFLSRDIRVADYRTCVQADKLNDAISGQDNAGLNGSDSVTIVWQSTPCPEPGEAPPALTTETTIYSIQTGFSGNPALFRKENDDDPLELVEGIENLQILYGQDTDNDSVPNHYVDAASITDMAEAVSVRFTLIASTFETDSISRNFTSTVSLRNRLP